MVWMPGGFLTLSETREYETTGIIWVTMPLAENANNRVVPGILERLMPRIIIQGDLELRECGSENSRPDRLGQFAKPNRPLVVNSKVSMATIQAETIRTRTTYI